MGSEQGIPFMKERIKEKNMMDLAAYQKGLYEQPELRFLFFELTDRCNLNCQHCGSSCTGKNTTFLNYDSIIRTMISVKNRYGTEKTMICLTGGEPLLYPSIYDVIRAAHLMGFPVGITTNATLIDDVAAGKMALAGLDTIAVSIDGIGETHDAFRDRKGCFDQTIQGIHALKKAGLEPQAITVVHKNNYHELDNIYQFLRKEEIYSWRLVNIDPIGRASVNSNLLLNGEELKGLLSFIRERRFDSSNAMEVTYGCSHFVTYDYENEVRDYYFQCGAGTIVASIMANGDIGACLDIERRDNLIQGNIYEDDFVEVWERKFRVFRRNKAESSRSCASCKYKEVCMGDSAHTWNYEVDEPGYCIVKMIAEV